MEIGDNMKKILISDFENVYTIGDGANDVEMIEKYNGYGMKNSTESGLKVTNKLVDNVYELLEEIVL